MLAKGIFGSGPDNLGYDSTCVFWVSGEFVNEAGEQEGLIFALPLDAFISGNPRRFREGVDVVLAQVCFQISSSSDEG